MRGPARLPLALLAPIAVLGGCAFTDVPLTLPTEGLAQPISGGAGRQVVVAVPFEDRRGVERCGMQKNGYNMDTADAVCRSDPAVWIAERLASELRAAGFEVVAAGDPHRASAVELEGTLLKLFVEPVIGAWSGSLETDLWVQLRATSETGLVAERSFFVKGWKGGVQLSTLQPYHTSLYRATQVMLEELVRAVIELMERYPQLGRASGPVLALRLGAAR